MATIATEKTLNQLLQATLGGSDPTLANHGSSALIGRSGSVILARRTDSDLATVGDGQFSFFNTDEEGRLKVTTKPANYADVIGNITAVQATIGTPVVGGTVFADVSRSSNAMFFCTGTFAGVNCIFEGSLETSGDSNWFGIQVVRTNSNTIETTTGVLSAQPTYAWEASVNGLARVRVRCTARTSGTQAWRIKLGTYATEPIPAIQVSGNQPVTHAGALAAGTARIGFVASSGIWYDDSSTILTANSVFIGTSRDATLTASATAFANAATYASQIRISAESDVPGILWLQVSRDNTVWRRIRSVPTTAVQNGGEYAEIIHSPSWRYWRVGYDNGLNNQTRFTIGSLAIAA